MPGCTFHLTTSDATELVDLVTRHTRVAHHREVSADTVMNMAHGPPAKVEAKAPERPHSLLQQKTRKQPEKIWTASGWFQP